MQYSFAVHKDRRCFSEISAMSKSTGNVYNSNTGTLVSHLIASEIPFCKQRTPCAILSSE